LLGINGLEWIIILAFILLLFGGSKLPELARSLGRAKGEFTKGQKDLEREMAQEGKKSKKTGKKASSKIVSAAETLGIDTEGKSEKQLKKEIAKKLTD
jgi:sec-independent protein translocase protein TatA